jgi:hypothetical protein
MSPVEIGKLTTRRNARKRGTSPSSSPVSHLGRYRQYFGVVIGAIASPKESDVVKYPLFQKGVKEMSDEIRKAHLK